MELTRQETLQILFIRGHLPDDDELMLALRELEHLGEVELTLVVTPWEALEQLATASFDATVFDMSLLPGAYALDMLTQMHDTAPQVPIVVIAEGETIAYRMRALNEGVQDQLLRDEIDHEVLRRSLRYSITRHMTLKDLESNLRQHRHQREMNLLEQRSRSPVSITSELLGQRSLKHSLPERYDDLVRQYSEALDMALEQRAYRVEHNLSGRVRRLAISLGEMKAGPRDVIQIHSEALQGKRDGPPRQVQAYMDESRLMLIELMGDLVMYYRNLAQGLG